MSLETINNKKKKNKKKTNKKNTDDETEFETCYYQFARPGSAHISQYVSRCTPGTFLKEMKFPEIASRVMDETDRGDYLMFVSYYGTCEEGLTPDMWSSYFGKKKYLYL